MKNAPSEQLLELKELRVFSICLLGDRSILIETEEGYELFNPYSLRLMKRFSHACKKGYYGLDSSFAGARKKFIVACRRNNAIYSWNKQRCFVFLRRVAVPDFSSANILIEKLNDKLLLITKMGFNASASIVWRNVHKNLYLEITVPQDSGRVQVSLGHFSGLRRSCSSSKGRGGAYPSD